MFIFSLFLFPFCFSSLSRRDLDQARRRKWIRTRAPKALPLDDPFRPLYLAWEVDVTPQGRLEVCGTQAYSKAYRSVSEGFDRSE